MTLMASRPRALTSNASSTSSCENPNRWVMSGFTSILPLRRNSMQSGHVSLYRNIPTTSTSLIAADVSGTVISLCPIPTRHTFPPPRVASSAVATVLLNPAQSRLTSMSPPIAALIRSTSSPTSSARADTLTAASAPRDRATERRCSSTSTITTRVAPNARAASRVTRPIGPAPMISTPVSGPTSARRHACTPTLSGSHMAPSSRLTFSGSLKHRSPGCTI
ncbi:Os08g0545300 [Oryza sativa Japonica Group]|uniref:Os08g0545300 protein n=2 Tax=Oryza sativa subsp. japonica TaxID=39947 RepID=Q6ZFX0_ORYSJ|nr:hypothetical protein EE612_045724 [Oryza sativa]BAD09223.1 unknown protein [Oryza sativa Japonica Group]BAD09737.1 unknown protein [Oryza sativa Japonica Group]BAF24327.1 Os08g0545300 [Oryza sativa Japonica Group]BAT06533.1 Os08g0545300 [Oryza sativa Japonica Group]|eukprot:NP_001062413.1 Os08g0545300 [Oryza sativa Japonica Group]